MTEREAAQRQMVDDIIAVADHQVRKRGRECVDIVGRS